MHKSISGVGYAICGLNARPQSYCESWTTLPHSTAKVLERPISQRPIAAVCRGHEVLMSICAISLGLLQRYERPQLRNCQGVHIQVLERPMSQRPDDASKK
ncbi:hypothetical protein DY000_02005530 [Brassica cretica]|uniref:Uncharacterized protein n=1 Tax=Brassica cretica TaxID=69181 RepID=A0ABQ7C1G5_BRACR|nr:hypothetical protein DY000_02005530 [Brassica cretica]